MLALALEREPSLPNFFLSHARFAHRIRKMGEGDLPVWTSKGSEVCQVILVAIVDDIMAESSVIGY